MSSDRKPQFGSLEKDVDLRTYMSAHEVFKTPNEVFALPINAIIPANKFAGVSAHNCIFDEKTLQQIILDLGHIKRIPKNEVLQIRWRGAPQSIHYRPFLGSRTKEVFDPKVEITILGYLNREYDYAHHSEHWAFIDRIEK